MYSQVPNKRGVLLDRGLDKILKFNKRGGGVKINVELEVEKGFK